MQKISPFLWFDHQAEEAANYYVSIFNNSKITAIDYYPEGTPGPAGTVMTVGFVLDGMEFTALNGGPEYTFSQAISFYVNCNTQEEVDRLWGQLSQGGEMQQCGWLRDKYGVTWQIVPHILMDLLQSPDREKSNRVMQAMLKMEKIDIALLQQAYDQE